MKTVNILEESDVQELINASLTPWTEWANNSVTTLQAALQSALEKIDELETVNANQNKRINALRTRVTNLEDALASNVITNEYTPDY